MKPKRIGILSSGGDAPGINATIRAVAKTAIHAHGMEVLGFMGGFTGITTKNYVELNMMNLSSPVSYTHLDVYKRQRLGNRGRSGSRGGRDRY